MSPTGKANLFSWVEKWLESQIIERDLKSKIEWIKLLYHKQNLIVF